MEILGPAPTPPTTEELISLCGEDVKKLVQSEADDADADRIWLLRKFHKNYLYYRDLQNFTPTLTQGILDASGISGTGLPYSDNTNNNSYDYTQNIYRGYCRKMEAVLGLRMPNCVAVPSDSSDEDSVKSSRTANSAAQYIAWHCDLQSLVLQLIFGFFNFGTNFWYSRWEEDGEKYGFSQEPDITATTEQEISPSGLQCPQCGMISPPDTPACRECSGSLVGAPYVPAQTATVPDPSAFKSVPNGALEITLHDGSEVFVPLDATSTTNCGWLRWQREWHKSKALAKWGQKARDAAKEGSTEVQTVSSSYGVAIRSSMSSPIGITRSLRPNYWTITDDWICPSMFEMVDDKEKRRALKENFPDGLRITYVGGGIVDMQNEKLSDHWIEAKPEPSKRIMGDPLGDDWTEAQDICNNLLNQMNEVVERSNDPGFADPTKLDFDAYQRRRDNPTELFPVLRPAGGSLGDVIYRPPPVEFSEQIPIFRDRVENTGKQISGETDSVWGGGGDVTPTARQQELMTNAALRQLGIIWKMAGKSLERLYQKACLILADHQQGILAFSKKDKFGSWRNLSINTAELKSGSYHFEADEAIPLTWGQQRDLMMWMLDKPQDLLQKWGFSDPLNISTFKNLLGMPGEHTPQMDEKDRGMSIIDQLINEEPITGQDGQPQASIPVAWEDDNPWFAQLAKSYLNANPDIAQIKPRGYQNVQLWGQAQDAAANQPPPPPVPKTSVAVSLKGSDLGSQAVQAVLGKEGLLADGVPVQSEAEAEAQSQAQGANAVQNQPLDSGM